MKKYIIVAVIIGVIGLILIIFSFSKNSVKQNPTILPTTAPLKNNQSVKWPTPASYYTDLKKNTQYYQTPSLRTDVSINTVSIEPVGTRTLPTGYARNPLYSYEFYESDKKYSPSMALAANIVNNKLTIYDNPSGTTKKTVTLDDSVTQSGFAWITDTYILLIEKNNQHEDNLYLVNAANGAKKFLIKADQISSGINVDIGAVAYNADKSSLIILTDLAGGKWLLRLAQT